MLKVAVIGPESTGKSVLTEQLSQSFRTSFALEYAREYLNNNNLKYDYQSLLEIAKRQVAEEDKAIQSSNKNIVFFDTNLYVIKVWAEFVFNKCHTWILDQLAKRDYDLYLLMNTDLPWAYDPMREYPEIKTRETLLEMYKCVAQAENVSWALISGIGRERLNQCIFHINKFLSAHDKNALSSSQK